jgi:hypothetical protein
VTGSSCRCGHGKGLHMHYRPGTDCGMPRCGCPRFGRPRRPDLIPVIAAVIAAVNAVIIAGFFRHPFPWWVLVAWQCNAAVWALTAAWFGRRLSR